MLLQLHPAAVVLEHLQPRLHLLRLLPPLLSNQIVDDLAVLHNIRMKPLVLLLKLVVLIR